MPLRPISRPVRRTPTSIPTPPINPPPMPTPVVTKRIQRYFRCNTEVAISSKGIFRNEAVSVRHKYQDGSRLQFQLHPFDAPKYDFISDVLHNMKEGERSTYLAESWFEIVIDQQSFNTSFQNILHQLAKLSPVFDQIRNLIFEIEIPNGGFKIESYQEYERSTIYWWFWWFHELVRKLSTFTSLERLSVVLDLPMGIGEQYREYLAGYLLPLYELETSQWKLLVQERELNPGDHPPQYMSRRFCSYLKRRTGNPARRGRVC